MSVGTRVRVVRGYRERQRGVVRRARELHGYLRLDGVPCRAIKRVKR